MKSPFFAGRYDDIDTEHVDVTSRLEVVKRFSAAACWRALEIRGLQSTVRVAIKRRLRKLAARNA